MMVVPLFQPAEQIEQPAEERGEAFGRPAFLLFHLHVSSRRRRLGLVAGDPSRPCGCYAYHMPLSSLTTDSI